ncbi:MAG: hypothetical protein K1000chlam3_01138 [Chlamydiae bacterium]|nr:hypothetical protein [Chlamydiota bacterium]
MQIQIEIQIPITKGFIHREYIDVSAETNITMESLKNIVNAKIAELINVTPKESSVCFNYAKQVKTETCITNGVNCESDVETKLTVYFKAFFEI